MGFLRLLGVAFLLIVGVAVYHLAAPGSEVAPLVKQSRAAAGAASAAALEKTADYWLGAAERRKGGDIRGSGAALALAIRLGRLEALRSGTEPLPSKLRRQFKPHFPEAVLEGARWTVAKPGSRLARVLGRWPVKEGAVTLGNVIVFKTKSGPANKQLFAHELAHVRQYRELGIAEFARQYAEDPDPIEDEARAKARRVARSL